MAAGEAGESEGKGVALGVGGSGVYAAIRPHTAGAAHSEHALGLAVQIQQHFRLQVGAVQAGGTVHPRLLVHGEHRLNGAVGQGVVRQNGQDHSHGDAVIAPQGGAVGPDPFPVGADVQALPGHVLMAVGGLGAHHVHVALEHHHRGLFIAGGGVLPDNDVVQPVLAVPQAQVTGKGHAQVADGLGVAAAVGHGTQGLKIIKYRLGRQIG